MKGNIIPCDLQLIEITKGKHLKDVFPCLCRNMATMRAGFPTLPEPTLGAPNLFILNNLLQYICKCTQMHKSPIIKKMNLLCMAVDPSLYTHTLPAKRIHMTCTHSLTMLIKCPISPPAPATTNALLQIFCTRSCSRLKMTSSTCMPHLSTPSSASSRWHSSYSMSKNRRWTPMWSSNDALIGSSSSMDGLQPKIARPIGLQWLLTGTPQWGLRYSPRASFVALLLQASQATQSRTRTP